MFPIKPIKTFGKGFINNRLSIFLDYNLFEVLFEQRILVFFLSQKFFLLPGLILMTKAKIDLNFHF